MELLRLFLTMFQLNFWNICRVLTWKYYFFNFKKSTKQLYSYFTWTFPQNFTFFNYKFTFTYSCFVFSSKIYFFFFFLITNLHLNIPVLFFPQNFNFFFPEYILTLFLISFLFSWQWPDQHSNHWLTATCLWLPSAESFKTLKETLGITNWRRNL